MAKRKKKRRPQNRPAPASPEQAGSDEAPAKASAKPPTSPHPERKARRDMAKKERERALRRYQRRQIIRRSLTAGIVVGVVVLIIAVGMQLFNNTSASSSEVQKLVAKAPADAAAAGCDKVPVNVGPYQPESRDHEHITGTPPALDTYPSVPPASGPHNQVPIHAGVYDKPPDVYQMIHGLEHGGVEFWYSPDVATSPEIKAVSTFVKNNQDHVAMAPYDYPGNGASSALPKGKQFALVSWHFVQLCDRVPAVPVVASFMASYRSPTLGGGPYKGQATELGASM